MLENETWTFGERVDAAVTWIKARTRLQRYWAIAWVTMIFNQVYAPAHDDWSVIWNIMAAVLWPLYWFAFSAFSVAHLIKLWI